MSSLALEYTIFIFAATFGVLQLAAVHSGLRGLSFLKRPLAASIFGAVVIIGAYVWFFAIENRNVPGLEGSQQLGNFALGASLAIVFTFVVSSILRSDTDPEHSESGQGQGLNVLRAMTYFQAIKRATLRLFRLR